MRVPFGPWTPDLPPLVVGGNGQVRVARNCIPRQVGYGPMPSFTSLAYGAIDAYARGALMALDNQGNAYNFVGNATKIYRYGPAQTAPEDVSRSGGYGLATKDRWHFCRFGDELFAITEHDVIQHFNLLSSSTFVNVTETADPDNVRGTAPRAKHCGVVRDHLVVGNTYDNTDGEAEARIWWPAIGDPLYWPAPRTDEAVGVQSGYQDLQGPGGWVQAIVEGAEVGAVLQERAIWRMDYVGGVDVYNLFRIEPDRGSMIPGLAIAWGREFLYFNQDGWWRCDYTRSKPIGEDVINREFQADLDTAYLHRISAVTDPKLPLSYILYPGAGNTLGTPNKILVYHWIANKFAIVDALELELLVRVIPPNTSLDDLDATIPDVDAHPDTFDERGTALGAGLIGAYDTNDQLGRLNGAALEATIEVGALELNPGARAFLRNVRPLVEGADATVQIGGVQQLGGQVPPDLTTIYGRRLPMDSHGDCGGRLDARYHFIRLIIPAGGFSSAIGLDVEARASGSR